MYLVNLDNGVRRQSSAPGAEDAYFKEDKLIIKAKIGFYGKLTPKPAPENVFSVNNPFFEGKPRLNNLAWRRVFY